MRKRSVREARHLVRRLKKQKHRRPRRARPHRNAQRKRALDRFLSFRKDVPDGIVDYSSEPGRYIIRPPENLSLSTNYGETIAFVLNIRETSFSSAVRHPQTGERLSILVDFGAIQAIGPAAGLMLAAEMDRRRLSTGRRPRALDRSWAPAIKKFFGQAGLFELLGIQPQEVTESATRDGDTDEIETLRFVRGRSVKGEKGSHLRDNLEQLCGKSIGPRVTVYDAIAEAIANTRHAYPKDAEVWPARSAGRWWASGTWDPKTNVVSIQLYDQGVGIPATLPRSEHWSDIIKLAGLRDRLHPERRHDRLLEAALEVGRTSTGAQGRGKGLAEMAAWIDKLGKGFLRITSGYGMVTYLAGGKLSGKVQTVPFPGTMIEWEIGLDE